MCLMGLYLVGSLFGGLSGFVTKRIAFREVAAGAVPYSWTLFALDVLMVWRGGEWGRGGGRNFGLHVPLPSSFLFFFYLIVFPGSSTKVIDFPDSTFLFLFPLFRRASLPAWPSLAPLPPPLLPALPPPPPHFAPPPPLKADTPTSQSPPMPPPAPVLPSALPPSISLPLPPK